MSDLEDPIPEALRYLRRAASNTPRVRAANKPGGPIDIINIESQILGTPETGPIGEMTLDLSDGTSIVLTVDRKRRT